MRSRIQYQKNEFTDQRRLLLKFLKQTLKAEAGEDRADCLLLAQKIVQFKFSTRSRALQFLIATQHQLLEQWAEAQTIYQHLRNQRRSDCVIYNLYSCKKKLNKLEEVVQLLKLSAKQGNSSLLTKAKTQQLIDRKKYNSAITLLEQSSHNECRFFGKFFSAVTQRDPKIFLHLSNTARSQPFYSLFAYNYSIYLMQKGQHGQAQTIFKELLDGKDISPQLKLFCKVNLAVIYELQNRVSKSLALLRQIVAVADNRYLNSINCRINQLKSKVFEQRLKSVSNITMKKERMRLSHQHSARNRVYSPTLNARKHSKTRQTWTKSKANQQIKRQNIFSKFSQSDDILQNENQTVLCSFLYKKQRPLKFNKKSTFFYPKMKALTPKSAFIKATKNEVKKQTTFIDQRSQSKELSCSNILDQQQSIVQTKRDSSPPLLQFQSKPEYACLQQLKDSQQNLEEMDETDELQEQSKCNQIDHSISLNFDQQQKQNCNSARCKDQHNTNQPSERNVSLQLQVSQIINVQREQQKHRSQIVIMITDQNQKIDLSKIIEEINIQSAANQDLVPWKQKSRERKKRIQKMKSQQMQTKAQAKGRQVLSNSNSRQKRSQTNKKYSIKIDSSSLIQPFQNEQVEVQQANSQISLTDRIDSKKILFNQPDVKDIASQKELIQIMDSGTRRQKKELEVLEDQPKNRPSFKLITRKYLKSRLQIELEQKIKMFKVKSQNNKLQSNDYIEMASLLSEYGNVKEAIQLLKQAINLNNEYSYFGKLGDFQLLLGEYSLAIQNYEKCLTVQTVEQKRKEIIWKKVQALLYTYLDQNLGFALKDLKLVDQTEQSRIVTAKVLFECQKPYEALKIFQERRYLSLIEEYWYGIYLKENRLEERALLAFMKAIQGPMCEAATLQTLVMMCRFKGVNFIKHYFGKLFNKTDKYESAELIGFISKINQLQGEYQLALDFVEKEIELDENNYLALFRAARLCRKLKDCEGARTLVKQSLKIEPNYMPSWQLLGILTTEIGKDQCYVKALQYFGQIQKEEVALSSEAKLCKCKCLYYSGDYRDAIAILSTCEPSEEVEELLALCSFNTQAYSKAIQEFERLQAKKVTDKRCYYLGCCYVEFNNPLVAAKHFKQAIELNDKFAVAYFNYGQCLHFKDKVEQAEAMVTKACELEPFNPTWLRTLYQIKLKLNKQGQMLTLLGTLMRQDPENIALRSLLAEVYLGTGDLGSYNREMDFVRHKDPFAAYQMRNQHQSLYNCSGQTLKTA